MKIIVAILGALIALFCGIQAYQIASAGVINQIPQLEGDGGAGLLFAVVTLISALVALFQRLASAIGFLLASLLSVLTAVLYSDSLMYAYAALSAIFAFTLFALKKFNHESTQVKREPAA